ncbi:MAG: hypothetical protein EA001_10660 [Oscillatoriales cyanobacterium]|nr:MAG: hypothetical protein EA001_10660 [Oscillatoriales cyanobacterium]
MDWVKFKVCHNHLVNRFANRIEQSQDIAFGLVMDSACTTRSRAVTTPNASTISQLRLNQLTVWSADGWMNSCGGLDHERL